MAPVSEAWERQGVHLLRRRGEGESGVVFTLFSVGAEAVTEKVMFCRCDFAVIK